MRTTAVGEVPEGVPEGPGPGDEDLELHSVVYRVRRTYREGGELIGEAEEETEDLVVRGFVVEPAHVGLKLNHTNNMGNYWSASVQVSLSLPCYVEEREEAFDHASNFLAERMGQELEKAADRVAEMKGNRGPGKNLF